jgi:hypothetical protein
MTLELECRSVLGGWQTYICGTEVALGPVFNKSTDLWAWQQKNIFNALQEQKSEVC